MTEIEAIQAFAEGAEAAASGNFADAVSLFTQVAHAHAALDQEVLASEEGSTNRLQTLANVAMLHQRLEAWAPMAATTTQLIERYPEQGLGWRLHATAAKHTAGAEAALQAVDHSLTLEPDASGGHHERACILVSLGRLVEAEAACQDALRCGSEPAHLLADEELSALAERPGFQAMTQPEAQARRLLSQLVRHNEALDQLAQRDARGWMMQDDTAGVMQQATALTEQLMAAVDMPGAPRRAFQEQQRVDLHASSPLQQEAIQTLVRCERFWHAIPFLLVLGNHDLPSRTADEARLELGIFDKLEPWMDPLRRMLSNPEIDLNRPWGLCMRLLDSHPDAAELWMDRGLMEMWTNNLEPALKSLDQAISVDPSFGPARANRSVVLVHLERPAEAVAEIARYIASEPNARAWAQQNEVFAALRERDDFQALLA